jgi:hypothetical protein
VLVEVVATAMGMMEDVGMMSDDEQRCSASIFGVREMTNLTVNVRWSIDVAP